MSQKRSPRAARRAETLRRKRRRQTLALACAALALIALLLVASLLLNRYRSAPAPEATLPVHSPEATAVLPSPTAAPEITASPTPSPTPTDVPAPTRTPWPEGMPDVLSFYQPVDGAFSQRARLGDTFSGPWRRGEDIASFEVAASDADRLPAGFFGETFGDVWRAFPRAGDCKIGYTLRCTLDDGGEIRYSMLGPDHIRHTEYLEVWLYDDLHHSGNEFYSHLTDTDGDTVVTSIKLTCGAEISHVQEIWLTAFVCSSRDEFDAEWNYIGDVSRTLHIVRAPGT